MSEIPKLSLKSLSKNDKEAINILSDALSDHGFFVITDHSIPHYLFDKAYEYSKKFFDLEVPIKIHIPLEKTLVQEVTPHLEKKQRLERLSQI